MAGEIVSKEARKGNTFEQQVADYMARRLEDERIERRVKNGSKDRGDITGLYVRKRRAVVECKCCNKMDLSGWVGEAEDERVNDGAEFGVVVHKRRGCGEKGFGGNYVTMTLDTFLAIVAGGFEYLGG